MALALPAADKKTLPHAPLELVVCQLRYDESIGAADGKLILAIHQALGGKAGPLPKLQPAQVQTTEVTIGPQGPVGAQRLSTQRGWQLLSSDGSLAASIMPDHCSLQSTRFKSWHEDYGPLLVALVSAVEKELAPAIEQRLGVRYVDRLVSPTARRANEWEGVISQEFLGPVRHTLVGPSILGLIQQLDIDVGDHVRCVVKHGAAPDPAGTGGTNYIIDTDVFHEPARAFDSVQIASDADRFHDLAVRVFQQIITPEYLSQLQVEE